MNYFDVYKRRIQSEGNTIEEKYKNSSTQIVNNAFRNSPFYMVLKINGIDTECRLLQINSSVLKSHDFKELALLPRTQLSLGSIVEYKGENWMTTDFVDSEIFPTAKIQRCNHNLKWQRNNTIHSYPTVVFSRTAYKDDVYPDKVMTLASGQFQLYIQDTEETRDLQISNRFFIGRDVYEIAYIDDVTLSGLLILTLNKSMSKNDRDNVELGIADYKDCVEHPPDTSNPNPPENGGGWW